MPVQPPTDKATIKQLDAVTEHFADAVVMPKTIYFKLWLVQVALEPLKKELDNPYFKSKYTDINALLAEVKPVLHKQHLIVLQPLTHINGKPAIKTEIFDVSTGESVSETMVMPENSDPQKMGSTITYFRRYGLVSMLALEAEDDDGNSGSGKETDKVTYEKVADKGADKVCPKCGKSHQGKFPTCYDCYVAKK